MSQFDVLKNQWDVPLSVSIEQLNASIEELKGLEVSNEGILSAITGVFSNTYNALKNVIIQKLGKEQKLITIDESLTKKLSPGKLRDNYSYLVDRQVMIPAGMKSTYLEYATYNLEISDLITRTLSGTINQLRASVGTIISTEGGLRDSMNFSDVPFKTTFKEYEKAIAKLGKLRKSDDMNAVAPYGDVFRNNNELIQTIDVVRKANNNFNAIKRKDIILNVETTMEYIKELTLLAKSDGYSKPLIQKIGYAVSCVAEMVEFYGAAVFNQEMTANALDNVNKEISSLV